MLWDVDKAENLHVGIRSHLCLFTTELALDTSPPTIRVQYGLDHTFDKPSELVDGSALSVPLGLDVEKLDKLTVKMHLSSCLAYDMGHKYNEWFSSRVGYSVKLLYIGDYRRKVLGNMGEGVKCRSGSRLGHGLAIIPLPICLAYFALHLDKSSRAWPLVAILATSLFCLVLFHRLRAPSSAPQITFADLAPYLIISKTSHANVNGRLPEGEEMDITKFRANIVVEGAGDDFEEDFWAELEIGGDAVMKLTQNCARCSSLNVDYATGKPGKTEAGKVLRIQSKDRRVDPGTKWSPIFGRYGFLGSAFKAGDGVEIRVGDEVRVTKRNADRTITDYPKE